jgi:hypothetical protein
MGFIIAFCSFFLIKKNQKIKSKARRFWANDSIETVLTCRIPKPEAAE